MEENLIFDKFNEWSAGLDSKSARISIFTHIRDIPYSIVAQLRDPKVGTSGILKLNKGSCQPKHFLLAALFGKLNIPIKYVSYPFKWQCQPLKFPDNFKAVLKSLPSAYHLACRAYIEGKWIRVDATYDPALKNAGFPVTEKWDGICDSENAVISEGEVVHENLEERLAYEAAQKSRYSPQEKLLYADFVEKLNLWIENIRKV